MKFDRIINAITSTAFLFSQSCILASMLAL